MKDLEKKMKKPSHKKQKKQTNKKKNKKKPYTLIPIVLTEMFALLKARIQKMRSITVNSPKRCASLQLVLL